MTVDAESTADFDVDGTFEFDGEALPARAGTTLAAALWASGRRAWRITERGQMPRGYFCGDGVCYDCLVTIDGQSNLRACLAEVKPGMRVTTQVGFGEPWS